MNAVMAVGVIALIFLRPTSPEDVKRKRWFISVLFIVTMAALAQLLDIAGFVG